MNDSGEHAPQWPMRVMRAGDRRSLSRSATRALDVLEYFGRVRRPLRAIEIARRFDWHPSTVNQLLKTMVESAHLTFEAGTKTYLPSPRLTGFSNWMIDIYGSDERLRGLIADIHARTHDVVTLTTPNDLFMQVIDVAGGETVEAMPDNTERGLRVSMFGSAIGAAYLSTLPPAEIRRLAERARIPASEHERLVQMLTRARIDGFAESASAEGSIWSVAVPVLNTSFNVPLVLGLAGPVERVRGIVPQLAATLQSAVASLGHRP